MYYGWEATWVLHQDRLQELSKDRAADNHTANRGRLTDYLRHMGIRLLSLIGMNRWKQKRKRKRTAPICQPYQTACDN